jgi:hypothetical protein
MGKDYNLKDTNYFDNNTWLVTRLVFTNGANDAMVVMKKEQGIFKVVLGPSSIFPDTSLMTLPNDVAIYLTRLGAVYGVVN